MKNGLGYYPYKKDFIDRDFIIDFINDFQSNNVKHFLLSEPSQITNETSTRVLFYNNLMYLEF